MYDCGGNLTPICLKSNGTVYFLTAPSLNAYALFLPKKYLRKKKLFVSDAHFPFAKQEVCTAAISGHAILTATYGQTAKPDWH